MYRKSLARKTFALAKGANHEELCFFLGAHRFVQPIRNIVDTIFGNILDIKSHQGCAVMLGLLVGTCLAKKNTRYVITAPWNHTEADAVAQEKAVAVLRSNSLTNSH